jgi:hypothetical protein
MRPGTSFSIYLLLLVTALIVATVADYFWDGEAQRRAFMLIAVIALAAIATLSWLRRN